jgi:putative membrane protein
VLPKTHIDEETYYDGVKPDQLILRDHLALDRTELANERTLLAYIRTALALFLTGFSALHLPAFNGDLAFEDLAYELFGWALVAAAGLTLVIGYVRYRRVMRRIEAADEGISGQGGG